MSPSKLCTCGHAYRSHGNPFTRQHVEGGAELACLDTRCNCVEFAARPPSVPTFETKEEQTMREAKQLPIDAFNAVTEECFYGVAMRTALKEDPAACEAFLRIAARTKQLRTAAERVLTREVPPRGA